jgi:uncharacterized protein YegJ (DUF2314 family)
VTEPPEQPLQLVSWSLDDGEAAHQESPDSFWMPPKEERESLRPGDIVKLMFRMILRNPGSGVEQEKVERMWVGVTGRDGRGYVGALDNDPHYTKDLAAGDEIRFEARHVIRVYEDTARGERG